MLLIISLLCTHCEPPFSFSISSCRCRISSQIFCSVVLLPRPKLRKVDKAKRLCLFHISPLLMNRPPRHKHAEEMALMARGNSFLHSMRQEKERDLYTWGSWIESISDGIVWSIHKVLGLCHYGFLHHLVPRHKHHFLTAKANAKHIPIDISQLWTIHQDIKSD